MWAYVGVAVAAGLLSWNVQAWRYDAQIADTAAQHATALANAHQKALDDTIKMQRTKDEAIKAAEQRAAKNAAAADSARRAADSLRGDLASVPDRIRGATRDAVDQYAATASVVFARCVGAYQELAGVADGHAADVRLMREAWPK